MKSYIPGALALAGLMMTAACGGGSSTPLPTTPQSPAQSQNTAKSTITMSVPLKGTRSSTGTMTKRPMFVDGSSDGSINVYFDGRAMVTGLDFTDFLATVTVPVDGSTIAGPAQTATALSDGTTYSYTSTVGYEKGTDGVVTNNLVATLTLTYATLPGPHTIGAVQTNGACNNGGDPCIAANNGFVLAEGQTVTTLSAGNNGQTALYLQGVMQSGFICVPGASCSLSNQAPQNPDGSYSFTAVPTDENGEAIPQQTRANGTIVPFDNGKYQVAEMDSQGVVSIVSASGGPAVFNLPGNDRHGVYGNNFTLTCNHTGTTGVGIKLLSTDPAKGNVAGFQYTTLPSMNYSDPFVTGSFQIPSNTAAGNYPAPNEFLGPTGGDVYYGSWVQINCSSTGTVVIQSRSKNASL